MNVVVYLKKEKSYSVENITVTSLFIDYEEKKIYIEDMDSIEIDYDLFNDGVSKITIDGSLFIKRTMDNKNFIDDQGISIFV